jgi:hypothetical protein
MGAHGADGADDALTRRGEAFLAMFDDADGRDGGATRAKVKGKVSKTTTQSKSKAAARSSSSTGAARVSARARTTVTTTMGARTTTSSAMASASASVRAPVVQTMVFDGRRVTALGASTSSTATPKPPPGAGLIDTKRARKAFMSAKTSRVFDEDVARTEAKTTDADADADGTARYGGMSALKSEVEAFGIKGLGKWDRQALENKRLIELGARPKKGPRIPRNIGYGLKRKNDEREENKRQEAFAAGYKLEKKAKKSSSGDRDRGLAWGSSTFKNGVVKVTKQEIFNSTRDSKVDTKAMLRGAPAKKPSGGKPKKKKDKAVKAGRKSKRR